MSALGQKRTYAVHNGMSALPRIATAKAGSRKRSCLQSGLKFKGSTATSTLYPTRPERRPLVAIERASGSVSDICWSGVASIDALHPNDRPHRGQSFLELFALGRLTKIGDVLSSSGNRISYVSNDSLNRRPMVDWTGCIRSVRPREKRSHYGESQNCASWHRGVAEEKRLADLR